LHGPWDVVEAWKESYHDDEGTEECQWVPLFLLIKVMIELIVYLQEAATYQNLHKKLISVNDC